MQAACVCMPRACNYAWNNLHIHGIVPWHTQHGITRRLICPRIVHITAQHADTRMWIPRSIIRVHIKSCHSHDRFDARISKPCTSYAIAYSHMNPYPKNRWRLCACPALATMHGINYTYMALYHGTHSMASHGASYALGSCI